MTVMAGLDPAIHVPPLALNVVDARPGAKRALLRDAMKRPSAAGPGMTVCD